MLHFYVTISVLKQNSAETINLIRKNLRLSNYIDHLYYLHKTTFVCNTEIGKNNTNRDLPMVTQMILSSECFTTNITRIRAFISMCSLMNQ